MSKRFLKYLAALIIIALSYMLSLVIVIRYAIDSLVFPTTTQQLSAGMPLFHVTNESGNELLVRHYGTDTNACVIFFPGRHGEITNYEKYLFSPMAESGLSLFALSYPGQNGALGTSKLDQLTHLVDMALQKINANASHSDTYIKESKRIVDATRQALRNAIQLRF